MTDQIYRQGDVLVRRVSSIPKNAQKTPRDAHGRIVLAHGERTGHAHTLRPKNVCSLSRVGEDDIEFLLIGAGGAPLRHEHVDGKKAEHDPINLPAGKYEVAQQVEYTPAELVRVSD